MGKGDEWLYVDTEPVKMVADYWRISCNDALDLDCYYFKALLIDAFKFKMKQTPAGRKYLEDCWYAQQTKADKSKLLASAKMEVE